MASYTKAKAQANFKDLVDRASKNGESACIVRGSKVVAALVPPEDYKLLQQIRAREDAEDIRTAKKALAEYRRNPASAEPWEKVKKDIGL